MHLTLAINYVFHATHFRYTGCAAVVQSLIAFSLISIFNKISKIKFTKNET